jgi:peptidoglycan/LPS O-acetylase OafA/YrhL
MRQHPDTPDQTPELPATHSISRHSTGLRGVAILLVLIHMLSLLDTAHGMPAYVFSRISQIGWTGVQLFFVLSGFLITGILLDTQRSGNYFSVFMRAAPCGYSRSTS